MQDHHLPSDIERSSLAIIRSELFERGIALSPETEAVVLRCIHATADFDYAANLYFSTGAVSRAVLALQNGAEIVWVDPNPENTKAIALYKRLGFQQNAFPEHLVSKAEEQNSIYMELHKD